MKFRDKVVVVTGASRGIGQAFEPTGKHSTMSIEHSMLKESNLWKNSMFGVER